MRKIIIIWVILAGCLSAQADISTKNNYTGTWVDAGSWTGGVRPNPVTTNIANDENINIYGYITRTGNLSFANIGTNPNKLNIYDTLIVHGSMTFANNSISLEVHSGGVLVIFGDFNAANKVDLANGGSMVVTGNMALTGGNQDYAGIGGLYVEGNITGGSAATDASTADQPLSNLIGGSSGQQDLYNFVQGGGSTPLPIKLGDFSLNQVSQAVQVSWTTLFEDNFDYFEVQRSQDGSNFKMISTVQGHGFSTVPQQYSFTDYQPLIGRSYYRLMAVDYDGSSELFESKTIQFGMEQVNISMDNESGLLKLTIWSPTAPNYQLIEVFDTSGKLIFRSKSTERQVVFRQPIEQKMVIVRVQLDGFKQLKRFLITD